MTCPVPSLTSSTRDRARSIQVGLWRTRPSVSIAGGGGGSGWSPVGVGSGQKYTLFGCQRRPAAVRRRSRPSF